MQKIFLRADADSQIGFGHFIRTLALADMLKDNYDCTFFTAGPTEYQKHEVAKVCSLVELPADASKFDVFLHYLTGNEIVFLDNYFFTPEYEKAVKDTGCKLVVLSPSKPHHYADVVVNYVDKDVSHYSVEDYTRIVAGLEWSLLREPFRRPVNNSKRNDRGVVVSFGGTDQYCLTEKVLDVLDRCYQVSVIMTSRVSEDRRRNLKDRGAAVHTDITAEEVAALFERNEYAILSSSTTCMEAVSRGAKVLAGYYVENQINYYNVLLKEKCILGLGNILCDEPFKEINNQLATFRDTDSVNIDFSTQKERYIKLFSSLC